MNVTFPARCPHGPPPRYAQPELEIQDEPPHLWFIAAYYDCAVCAQPGWRSTPAREMPAIAYDDQGREWYRQDPDERWE